MSIAFHRRLISALFTLILLAADPANANGVESSITDGQTKTGTVTGAGIDT